MLNYLALTGKLEQDPEMRYLGDNQDQPEASFSLAFQAGNNRTGRIRVTFYNRQAELVGRYLRQGARVTVAGILDQQQEENVDERERNGFRLIARTLELHDTDARGNTRITPLDGRLTRPRLSGANPQDDFGQGGD